MNAALLDKDITETEAMSMAIHHLNEDLDEMREKNAKLQRRIDDLERKMIEQDKWWKSNFMRLAKDKD